MATRTKRSATKYDVHPAVAYARAILENLPAKTGRSADEWVKVIHRDGPADTKARKSWLKSEHKLGATTAAMLVNRAEGRGAEDTDPKAYLKSAAAFVEQMYAGGKAGLRPLHETLIDHARGLGSDVRVCPCKTMVPLYRNNVFAQIKPSTRTRIDLGLALKGHPRKLPKRLIDTGGLAKGDRITHRIPITGADDIDDDVKRWLKVAYDLDG